MRPLLLLMDGHSSHYNPEVITAAAEEKIILFTLPPHTTHLAQPLDKGPFSPLKACWKSVCHEFHTHNPGRVVSRFDFSALFSEAWKRAMSQKYILAGFRTTGIYPFCRTKLLPDVEVGDKSYSNCVPGSLPKRTGLAYIPLYSPKPTPCIPGSLERSLSEGDLTPCKRSTSISRFLGTPMPPCKIPTHRGKSCGKVLTSLENLENIKEKEEAKANALREKQERKAQREAKALAKKVAKGVICIYIPVYTCTCRYDQELLVHAIYNIMHH